MNSKIIYETNLFFFLNDSEKIFMKVLKEKNTNIIFINKD